MTQIDFYHNAEDKLASICRIIGEAYRRGQRVQVYAPAEDTAERIDRLLWTQPAIGFIPHCRANSVLAPETPVVIGARADPRGDDELLVNLDAAAPPGFDRFLRLVEVVGAGEDDRAPARERYKHYRDSGHSLAAHDLSRGNRDGA